MSKNLQKIKYIAITDVKKHNIIGMPQLVLLKNDT